MSRKAKITLLLCILGMAIGFAAVSTVLYINGKTSIASNQDDFDVYFSKTIENGKENNNLIKDKTHIEFTTELSEVGSTYVLDYDVTNGSKNYDVNVNLNVPNGNEYIQVTNNFDPSTLPARTTRKGKLTLTVIKASLKEERYSFEITFNVNAAERETLNSGEITDENYLLPSTKVWDVPLLKRNETYISEITFLDTLAMPRNVLASWDVSNAQNGSIMAYALPHALATGDVSSGEATYLSIYIGQDGGVIANPDSSRLFEEFDLLNRINGMENFNTKKVTNMSHMFRGCASLTSLDVSHFDTSQVTDMSWMFPNDSKEGRDTRLQEIVGLENFDTNNVVTMQSMFSGCNALTSIDVSHFDTRNVMNLSSMFSGCSATNLDVSHFDTSKVTDMSSMFSGCSATNLDVSHFDTSKVTDMSSMFSSCGTTNLDVSHFDTSNVTDMLYMFSGYSATNLDLSHFDTSKVTDMRGMFSGCRSLTSLDVSSFNTGNVTDMRDMFLNCSNLTNLDLSSFNTSNVKDMRNMFCYCSNLTNLDLSSFDTSKVMDMDYMFENCSNLTNLDLSNFDTSRVIYMRGMFVNCSKIITNITIRGTNCTFYAKKYSYESGMFEAAATEESAQITVNYTADASDLVNNMIATKSDTSNVVKGTVLPNI